MGITHTDKTISESRIACDGTLNVTLSITAQPDAAPCPADIALVLDRSGSMAGAPMTHLQAGAKDFIDMVLTRTAASQAAAGSRIGIVSFDGTALADVPLTDDCAALQEAVDALRAQGSTNHADAFLAAGELLGDTARKRVLVIFTDGETTVGADPAPLAQRLRESGVEIYCVGLVGRTGLDESTLRAWANEPAGRYVVTRDSAEQLEDAFHCLADVIAAPGASDIHLRDFVSDDFTILDFEPPALGEAELEDAQSIHWHIASLGALEPQTACLTFQAQHTAPTGGVKQVNRRLEFSDAAGETPAFPSPTVTVACGGDGTDGDCGCGGEDGGCTVFTPDRPHVVDVYAGPCEDSIFCRAGGVTLAQQGRILQVDFTLRGVCPQQQTCVGVIVTELTESGAEEARGFKSLVIPAPGGETCQDVHVMCVSFVLPDGPGGCRAGRHLRVRILANPMGCAWNGCGTIPIV